MRHYNKDTRAKCKQKMQRTRRQTRPQIAQSTHLYDGYNRVEYIADTPATRDTHATAYVNTVNIVNAIIAPNTPRVYKAQAPYKQFIAAPMDLQPPEHTHAYIYTDTRKTKAIVYDSTGTRRVWYGFITRTIGIVNDKLTITLHRGARTFEVKPYIPPHTLLPYTHAELCRLGVETYKLP